MSIARAERGVTLTAFTCGWITLPASFFLDGEPGKLTVPATAFLIDHPMGLAVFDTGFGPRYERPSGTPGSGPVDMQDDANIGLRLRSIGVDPASVRYILNSHLHVDHAGGNVHLPNATVVVQAQEWDYAVSHDDRAYHVPEFDTGQPVMKISGEHDLFGDGTVVLFPTCGHTVGHQSARVRSSFGEVVLAADCCNLRRSLDEMRLPDHCFDAEQYMASLKILSTMRAKGTKIFYGHDPEFWQTVPQNMPLAF